MAVVALERYWKSQTLKLIENLSSTQIWSATLSGMVSDLALCVDTSGEGPAWAAARKKQEKMGVRVFV